MAYDGDTKHPLSNWSHRLRAGSGSITIAAMSDVTRILSQIDSGDPAAAEQLLPLVYDELRTLAAARLAHEKPGQTLQATALVNEAYLRLVGSHRRAESVDAAAQSSAGEGTYDSRGHFFSAAAEA